MASASRRLVLFALLCFCVPAPLGAGPSAEGLPEQALGQFERAGGQEFRFEPSSLGFSSFNPIDFFLKGHARVLEAQAGGAGVSGGVQEADLPALLNRQLKTSLRYRLGGKDVWFGVLFGRDRNAYVSVLEDGKDPVYLNIKELLGGPQTLSLGAGRYELSLDLGITNPFGDIFSQVIGSPVAIANVADPNDQQSFTIKDVLDALTAAGLEFKLGGRAYRLFYYDDVKDGVADKSRRDFAMLLPAAKGLEIVLIPAELLSDAQVSIFKLDDQQEAGLRQANGKLQIFGAP